MNIIIPSARWNKVEVPVSADTKKAFEKYYKNSVLVDLNNESITPDILMASVLASFVESEDFKNMEAEAQKVKEELKAEKEKIKAEKAKAKAEREAKQAEKDAEKIAKLKAELAKLEGKDAE